MANPFDDPVEKRRAYARNHYVANRAKHIQQAKVRSKLARARLYEIILSHLLDNACVDCGEDDPIVLEFDHRDRTGKEFNVSNALKRV